MQSTGVYPGNWVRTHNAPWEREFLPQIMTALQESGMAVDQWHLGVLHSSHLQMNILVSCPHYTTVNSVLGVGIPETWKT